MLRARTFLVFLGLLGSSFYASAQKGISGNPQLVVCVYNDAGIPAPVIERAQREVAKIFRSAGLPIEWSSAATTAESPAWRLTPASPVRPTLAMRIVPRSRNLSGEVFGIAFLGPDGFGQQADVFYDNVASLSKHAVRNSGLILGAVMAHELGHLVLGSNSHAASGLMKAHWDSEELKKMSMGQLRFEPTQAVQLQASKWQRPTTKIDSTLRAAMDPRREPQP